MNKVATVRVPRRARPSVRLLQHRLDQLQQRVENLRQLKKIVLSGCILSVAAFGAEPNSWAPLGIERPER